MTLSEPVHVPSWTTYCEGYHDRDFLAGLFEDVLQFEAQRKQPGIPRGVFGFRRGSVQLLINECKGKPYVAPAFANAITEAVVKRPVGLVLCLDEDDAPTPEDARQRAHDRIATLVASDAFDPATSVLRLPDDAPVHLLPITWCCADPVSAALPARQNLERLIVASCCEAYPERGAAVERWLASRPPPPTDAPSQSKAYSWSHMAGWFPSPGGNEFFRALWRDDRIRAALAKRMVDTGVHAVLAAMGVTPPWASPS